jgi:SAM-dependent methyltransferase
METSEYQLMYEAEDRHWWYLGLHDLVIERVRAEGQKQGRRLNILDAGCGTGRLCQLMEHFGTTTGCDVHPVALEATASRGIRRVFHCDLMEDPLGTGVYDLITSIDVLYHLMIGNESVVLRNIFNALKPGGLLILQVAAFEVLRGQHDIAVHTRHRYQSEEVRHLLQDTGFNVELASYRLSPHFLPAFLWRQLSKVLPKPRTDKATSDVAKNCPTFLNSLLTQYLKVENRLLTAGLRLPFGMSFFATARKPLVRPAPISQRAEPGIASIGNLPMP